MGLPASRTSGEGAAGSIYSQHNGGIAGPDFFRAFLDAGPGDPAPAGATDALRVLDILDAAYESGRAGRVVEVARRPD